MFNFWTSELCFNKNFWSSDLDFQNYTIIMSVSSRNDIESDDKIEHQNSLFLKVKIEHLNVTKMLWFCPVSFQNKISLTLMFLCQMFNFWRIAISWKKKLSNSCFFF